MQSEVVVRRSWGEHEVQYWLLWFCYLIDGWEQRGFPVDLEVLLFSVLTALSLTKVPFGLPGVPSAFWCVHESSRVSNGGDSVCVVWCFIRISDILGLCEVLRSAIVLCSVTRSLIWMWILLDLMWNGVFCSYNVMEVMAKSRQPGATCKKCSSTGEAFTGFISEAAAFSAYYGWSIDQFHRSVSSIDRSISSIDRSIPRSLWEDMRLHKTSGLYHMEQSTSDPINQSAGTTDI